MDYRFLDRDDDTLIATSELNCEKGIAVAVRTTGYATDRDEVIELAIVGFDGNVRFSQKVKPQNVTEWTASEASGGMAPDNVADAPELYQFEDEIQSLFESAETVVCQHLAFVEDAIEASWVSLPAFNGTDVISMFCESHCASDYPGQPAAAASLSGIAAYYDLPGSDGTVTGEANLVLACYRAIVAEHAAEREAKGPEHWQRYDDSKADERARIEKAQAVSQLREHRMNQMNGLLWIAGAIIFISLAIQLYQRGGDVGIIVISVAVAVFALSRGIVNFRK